MDPKISKPLSAGDVIMTAKPLLHFIENEFKEVFCNHCLKRGYALKKCCKCLQMSYCSKDCQTIDWKYHKNECKVFRHKNFNPIVFTNIEEMTLRLWFCVKSDKTFATKRHQLLDGSEVSLNDIKDQIRVDVNNPENNGFFKTFERICNHFSGYELLFSREELYKWFSLLNYTFVVRPLRHVGYRSGLFHDIDIGCGIYIEFSTLSYSCNANCAFTHNGLSLELRAMKSVAIGERPAIPSYVMIGTGRSGKNNSAYHLSNYCQCLKCKRNAEKVDTISQLKHLGDVVEVLMKGEVIQDIHYLIKKYQNLVTLSEDVFGDHSPQKTLYLLSYLYILLRTDCPDTEFVTNLKSELLEDMGVTHGDDHELTEFAEFLVYKN